MVRDRMQQERSESWGGGMRILQINGEVNDIVLFGISQWRRGVKLFWCHWYDDSGSNKSGCTSGWWIYIKTQWWKAHLGGKLPNNSLKLILVIVIWFYLFILCGRWGNQTCLVWNYLQVLGTVIAPCQGIYSYVCRTCNMESHKKCCLS